MTYKINKVGNESAGSIPALASTFPQSRFSKGSARFKGSVDC